jgi:hypothetical protein
MPWYQGTASSMSLLMMNNGVVTRSSQRAAVLHVELWRLDGGLPMHSDGLVLTLASDARSPRSGRRYVVRDRRRIAAEKRCDCVIR